MQLYCIKKPHELLGDKNVDFASHWKYPDVLILFFLSSTVFLLFYKVVCYVTKPYSLKVIFLFFQDLVKQIIIPSFTGKAQPEVKAI